MQKKGVYFLPYDTQCLLFCVVILSGLILIGKSFNNNASKFIQFSDTSPDLTCNIWITPFSHPSNRYSFLSPLFPVDVGKEHRAKLHLTRARVLVRTGHLLFRLSTKRFFRKVFSWSKRTVSEILLLRSKTCWTEFIFNAWQKSRCFLRIDWW